MSEEKKTYRAPKYQLAKGFRLTLPGFYCEITNELLQGPAGEKHIRAIQNYESETGTEVIGKMIVLK